MSVSVASVDTHAHRARAEQIALDQLAERMATRFPELPADEIARSIQGHHASFEGSRIRDFVPVLVERAVRSELATAALAAQPVHGQGVVQA